MDKNMIEEIKQIVIIHQKHKAKFKEVKGDKLIFEDENGKTYETLATRYQEMLFSYQHKEIFLIRKNVQKGIIKTVQTVIKKEK